MVDAAARALGRKIAFFRGQRGLSQRDFGAMIDRSETWVSQVERGVRHIDRMTVLRSVADALDVPLTELAAETPVIAAVSRRPEPAVALRMLLSSSLALALAVRHSAAEVDLANLRSRSATAWRLAHEASYGELVPLLTDLLPHLEAASRTSAGRTRRSVFAVLARTYHAAAAALAKLGETDAAWVAADRAIGAAERSGDRLLMAEGAFRLTLVFQADRRHEQAEHTARTAVDALAPLADDGIAEAVALQGALRLQLAVTAARQNDVAQAHAQLDHARRAATWLGSDRNDYDTEFGPTNVALHEVAVAVELGDAGTALRLAAGIDAEALSAERRARVLIDVARAHMQRRNPDGAIRALLDAERLTPEQVRKHRLVHGIIRDLVRSGHGRDERLRGFADRAGVRIR